MSDYPIWWDSTITVYNKYTDPVTSVVRWTRTVLDGCFWKHVGDKMTVGNVVLDTTTIRCRIPQSSLFLAPGDWRATPNDLRSQWFTLQTGDIIILGSVDFEIDEYKSGKRSSDLLSKYRQFGDCLEIKTISINTSTGMIQPHYGVTGI